VSFDLIWDLPLGFWIVCGLLVAGCGWAKTKIIDGYGLPTIAVLLTVGFWYIGDVLYNDYRENHTKIFEAGVLDSAWRQTAWFIVVFLTATPILTRTLNRREIHKGSGVLKMFISGVGNPTFQSQLDMLFRGALIIWLFLVLIATIRLGGEITYFLFPFLGHKAEPWGRDRIGGGFSALLSLAFYFQLLVAAIFGVVAALATNRKTRAMAIAFCVIAWPYFVFDRTRNTMLAAVVPGILSWGLLRVRGGVFRKGLVLSACFLIVNAWMTFVIANRSNMSIVAALKEKGLDLKNKEHNRHEGLNMFEELCWVNTFMERGTYTPNWGGRYFAEAVNIIPRALWPGKPLIGIDYAIARGQGGGDASDAGVFATISTGLIGQGVVNFGRFLGPAAAALLMGFWVSALTRLDLHATRFGRLPLYGTGLILTFNLGRDITLITLYPFVFGYAAIRLKEKFSHDEPVSRVCKNRPKVFFHQAPSESQNCLPVSLGRAHNRWPKVK